MICRILMAIFLALVTRHLTEGSNLQCWKIVFRGFSGIGKKVYSEWTKTNPSTCTINGGCIPENTDLSFVDIPKNTHLRSQHIGNWTNLNIKQVKIEFHNAAKRVMYMIFNGTGSTSTNWFSKGRLLESNYDDLYSDGCQKQFSMAGTYAKQFLVAQESYACVASYYWWMTVVDYRYTSSSTRYRCTWEVQTKYPLFLYAPNNHKSRFDLSNKGGFLTADAMSVYIKTD